MDKQTSCADREPIHLSSSKLLHGQDSNLALFAEGLQEGAFEKPLKALAQICSPAQFVSDPKTENQQAQPQVKQVAEIIGSVLPFAFLSATCKGAGAALLSEKSRGTLWRAALEEGSSGFLLGAVLSPSHELKPGETLLSRRLSQGLTSAATFSTMSLSSGLMQKQLNLIPVKSQTQVLLQHLGKAGLAGAAGGLVDAECRSGGKAGQSELLTSVLGFAGLGVCMELVGSGAARMLLPEQVPSMPKQVPVLPELELSHSGSLNDLRVLKAAVQKSSPWQDQTEKVVFDKRQEPSDSSSLMLEKVEALPEAAELAAKLKLPSANEMPAIVEQMLSELKGVKGTHPADRRQLGIYPGLMHMNWMTDAQKHRFIDVMARAYQHFRSAKNEAKPGSALALANEDAWCNSVSAVAELLARRRCNGASEGDLLEDSFLLAFFKNFRLSQEAACNESGKLVQMEREIAACRLMKAVGYPQARIDFLLSRLKEEELFAQKTAVEFPQEVLLPSKNEFNKDLCSERKAASGSEIEVDSVRAVRLCEHENLALAIGRAFPEKKRLSRILNFLDDFEYAAGKRQLTEFQIAGFYKQLNRIMQLPDKTWLDGGTRRNLVEQILRHASDLESISQGANNSCNVTTCENRLYARNPDELARLLADLLESGSYKTNSGKAISLSDGRTSIAPDRQAAENLRLQNKNSTDPDNLGHDGTRDYASQIVQTALIRIGQLDRSWLLHKNKRLLPDGLAYDRCADLLGLADCNKIEPVYDARGKRIFTLGPTETGFRKDGYYFRQLSEDQLIFDDYGKLKGCVKSLDDIEFSYDSFGNRITKLKPGTVLYDRSGKLLLIQSGTGAIFHSKIKTPSGKELERVCVRMLGQDRYVRDQDRLLNSPWLNSSHFRKICHEVNGLESKAFVVEAGSKFRRGFDYLTVSSPDELKSVLKELQEENNLPAIVVVNTKNPPWNEKGGGGHVINLHEIDEEIEALKLTNQWRRSNNFMDEPMGLLELFNAMQRHEQ